MTHNYTPKLDEIHKSSRESRKSRQKRASIAQISKRRPKLKVINLANKKDAGETSLETGKKIRA